MHPHPAGRHQHTWIHFNIFPFDKNMQIDASYSQIATSNLGTCYKELFDFSPRSCWKLTTQPSRLPLNSITPPCCVRPLSAYYFLLLCSLHSPLLLLLLLLSPFLNLILFIPLLVYPCWFLLSQLDLITGFPAHPWWNPRNVEFRG